MCVGNRDVVVFRYQRPPKRPSKEPGVPSHGAESGRRDAHDEGVGIHTSMHFGSRHPNAAPVYPNTAITPRRSTDRDPRNHEFTVQLRAMDTDRSGHGLGLPVLLALCGSLMERSTKGGLIECHKHKP